MEHARSRIPTATQASIKHGNIFFILENSKNDDKKEPTKMQNSSSRTDPKPTDATEEDIKPSKPQQGKVNSNK